MECDLKPGQAYRHYKTGVLYSVLCVSLREEDMKPLVTYVSAEDGEMWTCTAENFTGDVWVDGVPGPVRRFSREF